MYCKRFVGGFFFTRADSVERVAASLGDGRVGGGKVGVLSEEEFKIKNCKKVKKFRKQHTGCS